MAKCNICGKELLPGLVAVGIKSCLQCRDPKAYANIGKNKSSKNKPNKNNIRDYYNRQEEGYIGTVGGYE